MSKARKPLTATQVLEMGDTVDSLDRAVDATNDTLHRVVCDVAELRKRVDALAADSSAVRAVLTDLSKQEPPPRRMWWSFLSAGE